MLWHGTVTIYLGIYTIKDILKITKRKLGSGNMNKEFSFSFLCFWVLLFVLGEFVFSFGDKVYLCSAGWP